MTAPPAEKRHATPLEPGDTERLTLGPNDWLVIKLPPGADTTAAPNDAADLAATLGIPNDRVIVLATGVNLAVIQHGGGVNTSHPNDPPRTTTPGHTNPADPNQPTGHPEQADPEPQDTTRDTPTRPTPEHTAA